MERDYYEKRLFTLTLFTLALSAAMIICMSVGVSADPLDFNAVEEAMPEGNVLPYA